MEKNAVILPEIGLENKPRFQTYYNRFYNDEGLSCDINSSLTDQDFKMMTDVNYLLDHMAGHSRTPLYGVQENMTFEDWSNEMAMLKRRFNNLTPEVQQHFGNAQNFLKWCSDPNNYGDELPTVVEGLRNKEKIEKEKEWREQKADLLATKIVSALKNKE